MASSDKKTINRTRTKIRLINFNDTIIEGYVFLSYDQRVSDLLNDERGFLPVESSDGEVRVMSKRAVMEIEILDEAPENQSRSGGETVALISGNAFDILGAPQGADDAAVRAIYLDKIASVDPEQLAAVTNNEDLLEAGRQLKLRYAAAYDAITNTSRIEAIAVAMRATQTKRRKFGG